MKIEEIDNCDDLDDIKVFAILVTDVPSKYVAQAKKIDGKYYKEDCFGIEISYHADEDKYRPNMINNCIMWILTVIGIGWIILLHKQKKTQQ